MLNICNSFNSLIGLIKHPRWKMGAAMGLTFFIVSSIISILRGTSASSNWASKYYNIYSVHTYICSWYILQPKNHGLLLENLNNMKFVIKCQGSKIKDNMVMRLQRILKLKYYETHILLELGVFWCRIRVRAWHRHDTDIWIISFLEIIISVSVCIRYDVRVCVPI